MITLIRKSVFETNSSSTHSVSVGSSDVYDSITPNYKGQILIEPMEFGWGYDTFYDSDSRLSYLYIYARDWAGDNKETFMKMLKEVVMEHTGASGIIEPHAEDSWNNGYIDHQSVESNDLHYIFESKEMVKKFIFDKDSEIITDNDNH